MGDWTSAIFPLERPGAGNGEQKKGRDKGCGSEGARERESERGSKILLAARGSKSMIAVARADVSGDVSIAF